MISKKGGSVAMKGIQKNMKLNLILTVLFLLPIQVRGAVVEALDFQVTPEGLAKIEIKSDEPLKYKEVASGEERQLVIELEGAALSAYASRKLDTSSFKSPVVLINPFTADNGQSRIIVQLSEDAPHTINQDGNIIKLEVGTGAGGGSTEQTTPPNLATPSDPMAYLPVDESTSDSIDSMEDAGNEIAPDTLEAADVKPPAKKDALDQFFENQKTKKFTGSPVTLQLRDANLIDVFRLIGEASGFNIVVGGGVEGKITLSLKDVPWDQALDVVLQTMQLGAERNRNILRISSLAALTQEKQAELAAKNAQAASAPRITKVFPISYADPKELTEILSKFGATGGADGMMSGTSIVVDNRTNSIIVQANMEVLERTAKLIEVLDTQTPQVLIEAKIVEAQEEFARNINGSFGVGSDAERGSQIVASVNKNSLTDTLVGISSSSNEGLFGISQGMSFSLIPSLQRLKATLAIGEAERNVKIVSSPKVVVLNKKTANILQDEPVTVREVVITEGVATTTYKFLSANLSLNVTPTVTNDSSVIMQLKVERDVPRISSDPEVPGTVAKRNMETEVLVDSGTTLVIGGIYSTDVLEAEGGFPLLRHIPIIGWLFGSETKTENRNEIFIFITPNILNVKKAGLSG